MRLPLVLLLALFACCCGGKPPYVPDASHVQLSPALTVELVITSRDETSLFCGGTWISENQILTAGHCAKAVLSWDKEEDGSAEFGYRIQGDDTPRPFKIAKISEALDLAVLEADEMLLVHGHPIAVLSSRNLLPGDEVSSWNHTGRFEWSYMRGYVSGVRTEYDGKTYQVVMAAYKGASGAGIFDTNGHLQGVFSYVDRGAPGSVFCVHRDMIARFL